VSVALYMDVHVRRAVVIALRLRSVDVLTAQEDGSEELEDDRLLQRATELARVLVSQDEDLLREGVRLLRSRGTSPESFTRISFGSRSARWLRIWN
jgi:predicted nuclease of predicted toxin-antitoxin system